MTTTDSAVPLYPQTKLRIVANYHPGSVGEVLPPGQPENVEIEVNDPLPDNLAEFVDSLIASLFRHGPAGENVTVDQYLVTSGGGVPITTTVVNSGQVTTTGTKVSA